MTENQKAWRTAKDELVTEMKALGFPKELGEEIAKNLGSPKAMRRMTSWLCNEKPGKVELVVDEMLAICSEIEAWRGKRR